MQQHHTLRLIKLLPLASFVIAEEWNLKDEVDDLEAQ
jgi:hypothetical protein